MIRDRISFSRATLEISAGALVWAAHFAVIYGYTGLACARRYSEAGAAWLAGVPWVIGAASAVAVALMLLLMRPLLRPRRPLGFVPWLRGWVAGLALVGVVFEAVPVLMVPVCG